MSLTVSHMTATAHALSLIAPAKINLVLDVLRRRGDGFHEIRSLAIGVDLVDRVSVAQSHGTGVTLACNRPDLETPDNLVVRAVERLARFLHCTPSVRIRLHKKIPLAAGLGGGSSDAAAALRLCNQFWSAGLPDDELSTIGAEIGSDVPLFFSLPAATMTGRGEIVRPVAMRWSGWVLLISVDEAVPTGPVYAAWRSGDSTDFDADDRVDSITQALSATAIMPLLSNDLEPAIRRVAPRVGDAFDEIHRAGLGPMRVSGAGSTFFRLFDHQEEADEIAKRINSVCNDVKTTIVAAPVGPGRVQTEESS
jgi:4-diphosphocytidyl-2-C-methyl-D-erythritol kinase